MAPTHYEYSYHNVMICQSLFIPKNNNAKQLLLTWTPSHWIIWGMFIRNLHCETSNKWGAPNSTQEPSAMAASDGILSTDTMHHCHTAPTLSSVNMNWSIPPMWPHHMGDITSKAKWGLFNCGSPVKRLGNSAFFVQFWNHHLPHLPGKASPQSCYSSIPSSLETTSTQFENHCWCENETFWKCNSSKLGILTWFGSKLRC